MSNSTPAPEVTAGVLLRIADASGLEPSDLLGWNIPTWADQANIAIDGDELACTFRCHVDGAASGIVTAEQIDWMTVDGEQKSSRPDLVIRVGDEVIVFEPEDGDHVRALARALRALAPIWDEED